MKKIFASFLICSSLVFADNNSIGLDTLVGATIGVAIGNQIGKGNGKDVAKVAGGLLGAAIANNSRTPSSYSNNGYERTTTYVNNNYYNDYDRYDRYDRYYYDRRPVSNVTIVYQNYDRYPKRHYHKHHHRDGYGYRR